MKSTITKLTLATVLSAVSVVAFAATKGCCESIACCLSMLGCC